MDQEKLIDVKKETEKDLIFHKPHVRAPAKDDTSDPST